MLGPHELVDGVDFSPALLRTSPLPQLTAQVSELLALANIARLLVRRKPAIDAALTLNKHSNSLGFLQKQPAPPATRQIPAVRGRVNFAIRVGIVRLFLVKTPPTHHSCLK